MNADEGEDLDSAAGDLLEHFRDFAKDLPGQENLFDAFHAMFARTRNPVLFWYAVAIATAECGDRKPLPGWIVHWLHVTSGRLLAPSNRPAKGAAAAPVVAKALGSSARGQNAYTEFDELMRHLAISIGFDRFKEAGWKDEAAVVELATRRKMNPRQIWRIVGKIEKLWRGHN
jgi:hypothetical protein